jgi:hypothetical protein
MGAGGADVVAAAALLTEYPDAAEAVAALIGG